MKQIHLRRLLRACRFVRARGFVCSGFVRLGRLGAVALAPAVLSLAAALGGCSGNSQPTPDYSETAPPADQLYAEGLQEMRAGNYDQAVTKFNEIDEDYPYSTWAIHAEVLAGYSQYKNQDYDDALGSLNRYIALHPTDQEAAYAYYLKALCYYEQIEDVQRDQTATFEAIQTLNDVITRYPTSAYARDARIKLRLAYNRLAGHEMVIGRFYEKQHLYGAAIGRFQNVIQSYQTTTFTPEALERTTECYLDLGLIGAAQRTASVLAYNYPGSIWYQAAYNKLLAHNLVADAQTPAPARRHGFFFGLF